MNETKRSVIVREVKNHTMHALQKKVVIHFFLSSFLPVAICLVLFYLFMNDIMQEIFLLADMYSGNLQQSFWNMTWFLITSLTICIGVLLWWSLHEGRKIAGPILRINRDLETLLAGERIKITLRRSDLKNFHILVDNINVLIDRLPPDAVKPAAAQKQ